MFAPELVIYTLSHYFFHTCLTFYRMMFKVLPGEETSCNFITIINNNYYDYSKFLQQHHPVLLTYWHILHRQHRQHQQYHQWLLMQIQEMYVNFKIYPIHTTLHNNAQNLIYFILTLLTLFLGSLHNIKGWKEFTTEEEWYYVLECKICYLLFICMGP